MINILIKQLIILRGVPGAGKTTFANMIGAALGDQARVVAADDWFDQYCGGNFDPSKLGEAHDWCRSETERALQSGRSVIVHNTFTTEGELAPYAELAAEYGAQLSVLVVENRHGGRSVHNVPESTVNRMRPRLRDSIKP